ncbi:MAG: transporter substrate-binding domain-containing protein [Deltaproteobacteria bacterium]|nr:transporter substrate-binding domain-containing protein [Deltaproteobacteria bacterium]
MAVKAKTEASLIKELGTAQKKLSSFIYFGLLPRLLLIFALLFAGLAIGIVNAATDSPEIRVGSELEFPPYAFVDESGRPAGFSVDLIKAVADVMGLSIKISTGAWDTVWNELVAGRLDVLPIVAKLPERQRLVDFSLPHTETYDAFFVRQGNPQIQYIEAAKGKEIAVMRSDAAHHVLLERHFQGQLILVDTIPEGLSLISSGKHDAFLCSKLIGTMAIKKHGLRNLTAGPPIPDYKRFFSFAVKKGDAELLEKLNQGLLIIKTNRQYDQIYDKWLTAEDPWRKLEKYLWPAIALVTAIALIVGFWLMMLQLLVKKRTRQLSESNEMLRLAQEGLEERVAQRTVELANANVALQSEITERNRAEEALRERIKELTCFYAVTRDMQEDLSIDELCRRAVDHLLPAMQFPEITLPVIELNGKRVTSENYTEGLSHGLHAEITLKGEALGHLRVYYAKDRPFLIPEEQNLVNGIAEVLSTGFERKRAEEDLRKRTAELEFANRELEAFSYSVSHDLKAPVRAIQGFSRMLMAEHADKLDAEALRLLQVITTNTKLMDHLIDDLLALSRLGRFQIRKSVINLTGITNKVFEKLRSQAPERDLQLTLGDLPPGLGDQSLLYQVMENLLANAVKFTKSRKTAVIEVGGRTEDKENIYYVKDNGAGFDERYVDKLFRPFQRLHGGEEYEGTGVGLAIVQRIIQRHGGRVWAEGKLGDGATFGFALPKKED